MHRLHHVIQLDPKIHNVHMHRLPAHVRLPQIKIIPKCSNEYVTSFEGAYLSLGTPSGLANLCRLSLMSTKASTAFQSTPVE